MFENHFFNNKPQESKVIDTELKNITLNPSADQPEGNNQDFQSIDEVKVVQLGLDESTDKRKEYEI
jgi:hypothetical protein